MTPAYLALALYMFGVTVIETVAGRLGADPARLRPRGRWERVGAATGRVLVYTLWTGLVTRSVSAALMAGVAMLVARAAITAGERYVDRTARGMLAVLAPYAALWAAWALRQPAAHPTVVSALAAIGEGLTGTRPLPDDLVAWTVLGAACLFNADQATVLVRAVLAAVEGPVTLAGTGAAAAVEEVAAGGERVRDGLYRGGAVIGNLERFLILVLVLLGQLEAIGLVIAAKSIARFEMARERAEYFLVGTLASVSVALLLGLACRAVLA